MPSETVATARIRSSEPRNESGSVSPPAPSSPGSGKLIFAEKMRKMFGSLDPQQLELKIEQLWNGLTPSQREKFIGASGGEKENIKEKDQKEKKKKVPVLERRNNCKAIAKVLDLKAAKPTIPYSELVKNRMKTVWKDGSKPLQHLKTTPSPLLPCSITAHTPPPSPPNEQVPDIDDMPLIKMEMNPPVKYQPPKITFKLPPIQNSDRKPALKTVTRKFVVKKSLKPKAKPIPKISYDEASQEYYKILSQSFLVGHRTVDTTMLPIYANIMEGCQAIREYKFGPNL